MKNLIIKIVNSNWYWSFMLIQMPLLMMEDPNVEMLYTNIYMFVFGASLVYKRLVKAN